MDVEKIENLLKGAGVSFSKTGKNTWEISPGADRSVNAVLVCIADELGKRGELLKIRTDVTKIPTGASVDYLKEIFRKNRDMGHGAFALRDNETLCFVDTLELENCDQNEMNATLDWLLKAEEIFNTKVDRSKRPYLDAYRFATE